MNAEPRLVDADREGDDPDPFLISTRQILKFFGYVEPLDESADEVVALPVRLCRTVGAGLRVEAGPYTFANNDVDVLRNAIAAYDIAADHGG